MLCREIKAANTDCIYLRTNSEIYTNYTFCGQGVEFWVLPLMVHEVTIGLSRIEAHFEITTGLHMHPVLHLRRLVAGFSV